MLILLEAQVPKEFVCPDQLSSEQPEPLIWHRINYRRLDPALDLNIPRWLLSWRKQRGSWSDPKNEVVVRPDRVGKCDSTFRLGHDHRHESALQHRGSTLSRAKGIRAGDRRLY